MVISTPSTLLALAALLAIRAAADVSNVLLTGGVIATDGQLSHGDSSFVMQGDCNLVLYNRRAGFQSNTHGEGVNCTLVLTDRGQLVIRSAGGSAVWFSAGPFQKGQYAAVLRPDGDVVVYGPSVWSVPPPASHVAADAELKTLPMVMNALFSDQVLYGNAELATRDYTFVMRDDCDLALVKASIGNTWHSGTQGKGTHCFARLDHHGTLAVLDDRYRSLWSSKVVSKEGDYVLILQINGEAVVYGPAVWSTASG